MSWSCPVCGRSGWWVSVDTTAIWHLSPGHGTSICKRCVRTEKDVIDDHNRRFYSPSGKKDPSCPHRWVHPAPSRWYCVSCGAQYNWVCGCGGSLYACERHEAELTKGYASVEAFLAEHSW